MLDPAGFRALVSGRKRGLAAAALRGGLRLAEVPYAWAMRVRNWRYDAGRAEIHRVGVPVVSVGNLTLGGTGKTPMVAWLAGWLREQGVRVTLVSRGYGAEAGARNDEALELEQQLPDVPHVQNRDRVAAARMAIEEFECQMIVLDDGFQHRRLARDLDIVLLDALEPFGFEHVFPRGTLREPLTGLRRAHAVILSRAEMATWEQRESIRRRVASLAPHAEWAEVTHAPRSLVAAGGQETRIDSLKGQRIAAFCGLGNPAGFRHTLQRVGYDVVAFREFPDHHAYQRIEIESLSAWSGGLDAAAVLCTRKDLVKIGLEQLGGRPLFALAIGIEFLAGQAELEAKLRPLVRATANG
jgi:tetraacyldisaccharide 4'-kinase